MITKLFGAGVASAAAIGAIAAGIASTVGDGASGRPAAVRVQPVVVGAPLPLDPPPPPPPVEPVPASLAPEAPPAPPAPPQPAAALPTAEQLTDLLNRLSDPGVSYTTKENLVEGGIAPSEGHGLDHELRKAYRAGQLPLQFDVTNIQPVGPNTAAADVAISGPKMQPPVSKPLTFVDQDGNWVLSHDSAVALLQAFQAQGQ
ncbi:MAG TPA: hypothetical protein VFR27_04185 [Mycobacterium sp.]|nr:hypothetical protein [Mycobacterium sp.]